MSPKKIQFINKEFQHAIKVTLYSICEQMNYSANKAETAEWVSKTNSETLI